MESSRILALIGTGLTLGVVHVLTGPDHLSAVATLSANIESWESFYLGLKWGYGHSTGLVVVAVVLILINNKNDEQEVDMPDYVSHIFDSLVGVFMIMLGCYGIHRAWMKMVTPGAAHEGHDCPLLQNEEERQSLLAENTSCNTTSNLHDSSMSYQKDCEFQEPGESSTPLNKENDEEMAAVAVDITEKDTSYQTFPIDAQEQENIGELSWCSRTARKVSRKFLPVAAGIVHGLAGPGGVLGVIPAVEIHNGKLAAIYLGSFCLSSTLTMGCFASLYGNCSAFCGRRGTSKGRQHFIEIFSASLSIFVGVLWLVLLSLGKMEEVFP